MQSLWSDGAQGSNWGPISFNVKRSAVPELIRLLKVQGQLVMISPWCYHSMPYQLLSLLGNLHGAFGDGRIFEGLSLSPGSWGAEETFRFHHRDVISKATGTRLQNGFNDMCSFPFCGGNSVLVCSKLKWWVGGRVSLRSISLEQMVNKLNRALQFSFCT